MKIEMNLDEMHVGQMTAAYSILVQKLERKKIPVKI
jgi:hypothetical protein